MALELTANHLSREDLVKIRDRYHARSRTREKVTEIATDFKIVRQWVSVIARCVDELLGDDAKIAT